MPIQTDENFIVQGTVVTYQDKLYYVKKVAQVNYQVVDEQGRNYNLRIHHTVKRAPDQNAWKGDKPNPYKDYVKAVESGIVLGSTVEFTSATHRRKYGTDVLVVIGHTGDKYRLAVLGGDNNSYLRGFRVEDLKLVKGTFQKEQ